MPVAPKSDAGDPTPAIALDLFCPGCGYNLRGLTADRCPECGRSIDYAYSTQSLIPWVDRDQIGWLKAYVQTLLLVMFRQREFSAEMSREVDAVEARRFQRATLWMTYLPIAALLVHLNFFCPWLRTEPPFGWLTRQFEPGLMQTLGDPLWNVYIGTAGLLLFLWSASEVPSYFLQLRELSENARERATSLTRYAVGPLSLTGLATVTIAAGSIYRFDGNVPLGLLLFGVILPVMQCLVWWIDVVHLSHKLAPDLRRRTLAIGIGMPIGISLCLLVFVVLPTLAYSYL